MASTLILLSRNVEIDSYSSKIIPVRIILIFGQHAQMDSSHKLNNAAGDDDRLKLAQSGHAGDTKRLKNII